MDDPLVVLRMAGRPGRVRWQVRPTPGSDARRGLEEELVLDGVAVHTSCDALARGATTVRAEAPGAGALALDARPGYRFLLGLIWPDPTLGDRAFDDRYVLATEDVAWARWWLGPTERAAIAATFAPTAAHPFGFGIARGAVRFVAGALPARPQLEAARRAAAFIATRDERATAEWRALAAPLGATIAGDRWTCDGRLALRTGRGAVAVELRAGLDPAGRLVTRAAVAGRNVPARAVGLAAEADEAGIGYLALYAERAIDRLAPRRDRRAAVRAPAGHHARTTDPAWAAGRIAALAPALAVAHADLVEVAGERAIVTWSGPVLDARRLAAGADVVARAVEARTARPPYR